MHRLRQVSVASARSLAWPQDEHRSARENADRQAPSSPNDSAEPAGQSKRVENSSGDELAQHHGPGAAAQQQRRHVVARAASRNADGEGREQALAGTVAGTITRERRTGRASRAEVARRLDREVRAHYCSAGIDRQDGERQQKVDQCDDHRTPDCRSATPPAQSPRHRAPMQQLEFMQAVLAPRIAFQA